MEYHRKNQGKGTKETVNCSLPEVYDSSLAALGKAGSFRLGSIQKQERAIYAPGVIDTAIFFYPSDDGQRTEIEVLSSGQGVREFQRTLLSLIKLGSDCNTYVAGSPSKGANQQAPVKVQAVDARPAVEVKSDVDVPKYKVAERANDFAIVVGIEKYSDLPNAEFAERDADAVKAHLMALGLPPRNIIHLSGSKAGRSSIEKYVEQWLPRLAKEDSRIFFYFSGHGAPDVKSGAAYLVPWDGDANFLETTGYPIKRLYEKLSALQAKEIIVAMDTCFSGAGGRSVLPPGARPLVAKTEQFAAMPKIVSLTASAGDQISGTESAQGHGAFTYYLLKGLNGAAKDQTLQGLYDYLKPQVQDTASRLNRDQTPQILGEQTSLRLR